MDFMRNEPALESLLPFPYLVRSVTLQPLLVPSSYKTNALLGWKFFWRKKRRRKLHCDKR